MKPLIRGCLPVVAPIAVQKPKPPDVQEPKPEEATQVSETKK